MIKQLFSTFILFIALKFIAFSQSDAFYKHSTIPEKLKTEVTAAVIRQYDVDFEVKSKTETITKEHKIVTVLNEKGKYHAYPSFFYNKFFKIDEIEASIYDASGKLIKKVKKKDIYDSKNYQHGIDDSRFKVVDFPYATYPYTIEYTVIRKSNQSMFYEHFFPQQSHFDAVESASFSVTVPEGTKLRYKEVNIKPNNLEHFQNKYRWTFGDIAAYSIEPFTPFSAYQLPAIYTAANEFQIGEYSGDMSSWKNLGLFENQLTKNRQELSEETKAKIKKMVANCKDEHCKIETIYQFLQENTRYFSIQLGVGGWQPTTATIVDKDKYSDCKGLSNYMIAMLDVVGIKAYHVLINRGSDDWNKNRTQADFSASFFNHMMACVPFAKDTVWLECTNQTTAVGQLESSDQDRPVVIITPEGGKLTRTPKFDERHNITKKNVQIILSQNGSANYSSTTQYNGLSQDYYLMYLENLSQEEKEKIIYESLTINNFEIKKLLFEKIIKPVPFVKQELELQIRNLASVSGDRLFVPFSTSALIIEELNESSTRKYDFQPDEVGVSREINTEIIIPEGYKVEAGIENLNLNSPFGSYTIKSENGEKEIKISYTFTLNSKIFPKEKYQEFNDFLKKAIKNNKSKIVLVKK